ncbi:hypothetical protein [Vibrio phage Va2]|nr:hypothetical protein [Vibrio phage Va2]
MFALEEGLVTFSEASSTSPEDLQSICEEFVDRKKIKERRRRKKRVRNHRRSRIMKKAWKSKRRYFEKGIKKFHKSIKGKKLHQRVARNRKKGRYRNIHEAMTQVSSLLTHLSLQSQYYSTIDEEVENELLLEEGSRILAPILEALPMHLDQEDFTLADIFEADIAEEAKDFIEDVVLALECSDDDDELDESDEDITESDVKLDKQTGAEIKGEYDEDELTLEEKRKLAADLVPKLQGNNDNEVDGSDIKDKSEGDEPSEPEECNKSKVDECDKSKVEESRSLNMDDLEDITEDFDEEDVKILNGDEFDIIDESSGDPDVDGKYVIAKVRGPAFFPGKVSRNNVEYTMQLWRMALERPEFQRELKARRIYGTIGHDQVINDKAIREGKIGHIVSKMWIDEETGVGMAEYLLLNSLPGRMTLTLLGAKSEFRVSTRCRGKFLTRKNVRGHKEPDPKLFFIRGVDFVGDPGFLETSAEITSAMPNDA